MSERKIRKRKVYDCTTVGELIDFIAYRFEVDPKYVKIDGADKIFIGSVRRKDLTIKRIRMRTPDGMMNGIALYQITSKILKGYYE